MPTTTQPQCGQTRRLTSHQTRSHGCSLHPTVSAQSTRMLAFLPCCAPATHANPFGPVSRGLSPSPPRGKPRDQACLGQPTYSSNAVCPPPMFCLQYEPASAGLTNLLDGAFDTGSFTA